MATKKKRKKSHTRRRRRSGMGAINLKSVGIKVVGIAAGAFADNLVRKNMTTLNPKILGVAEIAVGIFIPKFLKGDLGEGISDGLIAVGTINLLKSFQVISGVGAMPRSVVPLRRQAIPPSAPAIGAGGRAYLTNTVGDIGTPAWNYAQIGAMGELLYEE